MNNIDKTFKCYFCQTEWFLTFWQKMENGKHDNIGDFCPRCRLPQRQEIQVDKWRIHFRKFTYGIVSPYRSKELEDWMEENFTYKGKGDAEKHVHARPLSDWYKELYETKP